MEVLYHSGVQSKDGDPGQTLKGSPPYENVRGISQPTSEGKNEKTRSEQSLGYSTLRRTAVIEGENGPGAGHGFYFLLIGKIKWLGSAPFTCRLDQVEAGGTGECSVSREHSSCGSVGVPLSPLPEVSPNSPQPHIMPRSLPCFSFSSPGACSCNRVCFIHPSSTVPCSGHRLFSRSRAAATFFL